MFETERRNVWERQAAEVWWGCGIIDAASSFSDFYLDLQNISTYTWICKTYPHIPVFAKNIHIYLDLQNISIYTWICKTYPHTWICLLFSKTYRVDYLTAPFNAMQCSDSEEGFSKLLESFREPAFINIACVIFLCATYFALFSVIQYIIYNIIYNVCCLGR